MNSILKAKTKCVHCSRIVPRQRIIRRKSPTAAMWNLSSAKRSCHTLIRRTAATTREYFRRMCYAGLHKYYGENPKKEIVDRLEYEISTIDTMGYVNYYLIVYDFIRQAKSMGIPVGPGRGSGVGSLAAYCIGITGVDPLRYDLLFERFLNPERVSMPDFDVDFSDERRQEIIEYVTEKYGTDHVAQIVTFGTMAARACDTRRWPRHGDSVHDVRYRRKACADGARHHD